MNLSGFGVMAPGSSSASWLALRPFSGSDCTVLAGQHLADGGRLGLEHGRLRGHLDGVLEGADLHLQVDAGDLLRLERDRPGWTSS